MWRQKHLNENTEYAQVDDPIEYALFTKAKQALKVFGIFMNVTHEMGILEQRNSTEQKFVAVRMNLK